MATRKEKKGRQQISIAGNNEATIMVTSKAQVVLLLRRLLPPPPSPPRRCFLIVRQAIRGIRPPLLFCFSTTTADLPCALSLLFALVVLFSRNRCSLHLRLLRERERESSFLCFFCLLNLDYTRRRHLIFNCRNCSSSSLITIIPKGGSPTWLASQLCSVE